MSWKYIMLQIGDQAVPVIFPDIFVHSFMAGAMQLVADTLNPEKDLRPKQLESMLEAASAPVVSAGLIPGFAIPAAVGNSDTLRKASRPEDTRIINNFPYEQGREGLAHNVTERLLLQATIELLMTRIAEIDSQ